MVVENPILIVIFTIQQSCSNVQGLLVVQPHFSAMQIKACHKEALDKAAIAVSSENRHISGTGKIDNYQ